MSLKYNLGVSGDINTPQGLEVYVYNEEKVASIKLYNFEFLEILHNGMYNLLPDEPNFNYSNCLLSFNLYVNENYRKNGYGKIIVNLALEECKKLNVEYFLGYRMYNNKESELFWNKMNFTKLINDENIEVFYKKI